MSVTVIILFLAFFYTLPAISTTNYPTSKIYNVYNNLCYISMHSKSIFLMRRAIGIYVMNFASISKSAIEVGSKSLPSPFCRLCLGDVFIY